MFIQLNTNNMNNDVYIINSEHIISIVTSTVPVNIQKYKIYLSGGHDIILSKRSYDELLSKLKQGYVEIV